MISFSDILEIIDKCYKNTPEAVHEILTMFLAFFGTIFVVSLFFFSIYIIFLTQRIIRDILKERVRKTHNKKEK